MDEKNKILSILKNKKILIPGIIILLLFISLWHTKKNKITYQTQKLGRCTITQVVEASGTINPVNIVSVGSTVSGLMKEIYVDYNSEVKKG